MTYVGRGLTKINCGYPSKEKFTFVQKKSIWKGDFTSVYLISFYLQKWWDHPLLYPRDMTLQTSKSGEFGCLVGNRNSVAFHPFPSKTWWDPYHNWKKKNLLMCFIKSKVRSMHLFYNKNKVVISFVVNIFLRILLFIKVLLWILILNSIQTIENPTLIKF